MVQARPLQLPDIPDPWLSGAKHLPGGRTVKRSGQILAQPQNSLGKIQRAQLEFLALPIGQNQSHPVHPQCLSDPRGNGLENIAQFKVGDHAVVQVENELSLVLSFSS